MGVSSRAAAAAARRSRTSRWWDLGEEPRAARSKTTANHLGPPLNEKVKGEIKGKD